MSFGKRQTGFGKRGGPRAQPGALRAPQPSDNRRSERIPGFKNGKILTRRGAGYDCVVRNTSQHGCLVTLIEAEALPETVKVRLDMFSPERPARVVWRDQGVAGLEFLDVAAAPPVAAPQTGFGRG